MKKSLILFTAVAVSLLHYGSAKAQCQNSQEFSAHFSKYNALLKKDTLYEVYNPKKLQLQLEIGKVALQALKAVQTETDYIIILDEIDELDFFPREVKEELLFREPLIQEYTPGFKDNHLILNEIHELYKNYSKELANHKFNKEALYFVNNQIKTVSLVTDSTFAIVSKVYFTQSLDKYSNYELFILRYYISEVFDILAGFQKEEIEYIVFRLKTSNCFLYIEMAEDMEDYIKD